MANNYSRSPLFYVGDKYKLLPKILPYFPAKIDRFIEPFMGGGSVFLNVESKEYLGNDIDRYVYLLHTFLIKQSSDPNSFFSKIETIISDYSLSHSYKDDIIPKSLKQQFRKTYFAKFNKEGFNKLKSDFNDESSIDPFKFYVLLIYGFNRMIRFNKQGKYNLPVGNVDFNSNVINALEKYFDKVKEENIALYNLDYIDFLKKAKPNEKDFVYFDPPYLITFSEYNKLWNKEKEMQLLKEIDKLNKQKIKFAVSNVILYKEKENKIFNDWSKKYNSYPVKSNYISYHDNTVKSFKEVLVTNYDKEKL